LSNLTVVVGKTEPHNNNVLMNHLQMAIGEALEITGVTNNQAGLLNNALMNRLQVVTEETSEVTGVMNRQAGLHRATPRHHAALTAAVIAVVVADFQDLLAEIKTIVVAIPVDPAGRREDPDKILLFFS
jgi:hypothetical protein